MQLHNDILLINPPFSMPDKPCISIPTLAAYLKEKGFSVRGLDASIEFFRRFLSPENLQACKTFAEKRLSELNDKLEMKFAELMEYLQLVEAIQQSANIEDKLPLLFEPYLFSNVEKFNLFHIALKLASVPHFPEWLGLTDETGYIRYTSKYSKFSSKDILESLKHKTLYSQYLEAILLPILQQHTPFLVGISLTFPDQVYPTFKCAQIIKTWFPDTYVTIGGAFVSCHMRKFANTDLFDVADSFILDDGEIPLEMLGKELSTSTPNLSNVPGLIYLSNGKIMRNAPATPIDMELLPAPDYSIFPIERYLIKRSSMALLFRLSRGCYWAKCAFCKTELPIINCHFQPSSEYVFDQLKAVIEQTDVRIFHFTDDAASPEVIENVSRKLIDAQIKIKWAANFRFDKRLTRERLRLYEKAGCHIIYLGLESYTPRLMRLMRKGISETLVEEVLTNISLTGITAIVYMIVGFPTETEEEARESYQKILKLKERGLIKRFIYNVFELEPYSTVGSNPSKFGITKIHTRDNADLMPPISLFESEGMKRQQAFQLLSSFIQRPRDIHKEDAPKKETSITSLVSGDKVFYLNFSLDEMQKKIMETTSDHIMNIDQIKEISIQRNVR